MPALTESDRARESELAAVDSDGLRAFLNAITLLAWPKVFEKDLIVDPQRLRDALGQARPLADRGGPAEGLNIKGMHDIANYVSPEDDPEGASQALSEYVMDAFSDFERHLGVTLGDWAEGWMSDDSSNYVRRWSRGYMDGRPQDLKWIKGNAHLFADPQAALHFAHEDLRTAGKRQAKYRESLETLVSKLDKSATKGQTKLSDEVRVSLEKLRKKGTGLTAKQERLVEALARYKRLERWLRAAHREIVMDLVLANGGQPVDMKKVQSRFKSLGITDHPWPREFVGKLGVSRKPGGSSLVVLYYTRFDELLKGTPSGRIHMNPAYKRGSSSHYVRYVPEYSTDGKEQYIQTVAGAAAKQETKFGQVGDLIEAIDLKSLPWRKGLLNDSNPHQDTCACIEFLYQTACRVGSESGARSGSFGASTLMRKHVKAIKGGSGRVAKFDIRFFQKRRNHRYELEARSGREVRKLMSIMGENARLRKGQDKRDAQGNRLFTSHRGRPVTSRDVNELLKSMGLPTAHKFRHARGTRLMDRMLADACLRLGPKPEEAEVADAYWKAAIEVAKELHHVIKQGEDGEKPNAATSIRSYIAPELTRTFFSRYGYPMPKRVKGILAEE